ncbi:hypothetical protein [Vibrio sp. 10N.261.52.A1]|uniref:hypothetical protein n=1 Tax=Vibrio TaxID=662 RepID=UPI000C82F089|nr:hypothetical protein [Vibrio sp. 10N.261.52.A1]PML64755.1 hypothetical protein BCT81_06820 [Vibrio sp. 10N.261.52.A1]
MTSSSTINQIDRRVAQALDDKEWGDARSWLDEIDPQGRTNVEQLNALSEEVRWSFDEVGWGYFE